MHTLWIALFASFSGLLFAAQPAFQLSVGKALPDLTISAQHGGMVADQSPWTSKSLRGRVQFVIYVDPDDSTLNDELIERLRVEKPSDQVFGSTAIINLAASWKPNSLIMSRLKEKQERFPRTAYVFDKDQFAAKEWGLVSEGYHVLLLDQDGTVLFQKTGQLDTNEINHLLSLVRLKTEALASRDTKKSAN